jgi:O-succinylbenzoic acid--CoA ligase
VPDATLVVATSGTSGRRRLVPLTMANLAAAVAASRRRLGTDQGDRWLLCLPIDHIGGLSVLLRSFEAGGTVVVGPFDQDLVALIRRMRPTVASLVPTMVHRLLTWDPEALASIGLVLVGGGRLPPSVAMRALDAGVPLVATYGSTETASQVATMRPGEPWRHPGFVGAPLEGFTVTIEGADVSGAGTVTIDGPAVFSGYAGEPAREGPFRSSDIGRLADDGTLTLLGRVDDVVVTGGLNVSLTEVEDAIASIDGVDDVAVVGCDDDEWGTVVCAMVSADMPLGRVRDAAGRSLLPHQVPRRWVASAIPLLPNGKPDKAGIEMAFRNQ